MRHPITRADELVQGGQGRSADDLKRSADVIGYLMAAILVALGLLCGWSLIVGCL